MHTHARCLVTTYNLDHTYEEPPYTLNAGRTWDPESLDVWTADGRRTTFLPNAVLRTKYQRREVIIRFSMARFLSLVSLHRLPVSFTGSLQSSSFP